MEADKKKLQCADCGALKRNRSEMSLHRLRTHASQEAREAAKPHRCPHCPLRFFSRCDLKRHSLTHRSGDRDFDFGNGILDVDGPFKCIGCDAMFDRRDLLKRHAREVHKSVSRTPSSRRPSPSLWLCHVCGAAFTRGTNLERHVEAMHGPRGGAPVKGATTTANGGDGEETGAKRDERPSPSEQTVAAADGTETLPPPADGAAVVRRRRLRPRGHPLDAPSDGILVHKLRRSTPKPKPLRMRVRPAANGSDVDPSFVLDRKRERRGRRKWDESVNEKLSEEFLRVMEREDDDGLGMIVQRIQGKGLGVVSRREFLRGQPVLEYAGEVLPEREGFRRERVYAQQGRGMYILFFVSEGTGLCVDATEATGRKGRFVNHSRRDPNLRPVVRKLKTPRVVLVANRNIACNEELTFDYGERRFDVLRDNPWLRQ